MAYNLNHFGALIARTIIAQELYSEVAVLLLLGTAAVESDLGTNLVQIGGGPGLGAFQMEPATKDDIWNNYLQFRPDRRDAVIRICKVFGPDDDNALLWNLRYSICMARLRYRRVPEPFPSTIKGLAHYWKDHYNTVKGKGTVEDFLKKWDKYVRLGVSSPVL